MGPVGGSADTAEIACQAAQGALITSGGGFSTVFPAPSWQTSVIDTYFNSLSSQPNKGYAATGRGYPDVAVLGHNYVVVDDGSCIEVDGTSAAAPVTAAMISLVNGQRALKGLSKIGWFNPALYSLYSSFTNDITSGSNNCGEQNDDVDPLGPYTCCEEGFSCSKGWDPVTVSVIFYSFFFLLKLSFEP